jgi:hypothetical protein
MKTLIFSLMLALCLVAKSAFVFAQSDGQIIEFLVQEKGVNLTQFAQIQDGRIVVENMGGDANSGLLFDAASMTLYIINHRDQSYYKIDQSVINKAGSMIDSLSAVAESQEGVLSDLMTTLGLSDEDANASFEIRKTENLLSSANIECQLFQQFRNKELESELCIAPKQGLNILGSNYETLDAFYVFGDRLAKKAGSILQNIGIGLPNLSKMGDGGLPILAYVVSEKLKISVTQIIPGHSDSSKFNLPSGYVQTPIPFIG